MALLFQTHSQGKLYAKHLQLMNQYQPVTAMTEIKISNARKFQSHTFSHSFDLATSSICGVPILVSVLTIHFLNDLLFINKF